LRKTCPKRTRSAHLTVTRRNALLGNGRCATGVGAKLPGNSRLLPARLLETESRQCEIPQVVFLAAGVTANLLSRHNKIKRIRVRSGSPFGFAQSERRLSKPVHRKVSAPYSPASLNPQRTTLYPKTKPRHEIRKCHWRRAFARTVVGKTRYGRWVSDWREHCIWRQPSVYCRSAGRPRRQFRVRSS